MQLVHFNGLDPVKIKKSAELQERMLLNFPFLKSYCRVIIQKLFNYSFLFPYSIMSNEVETFVLHILLTAIRYVFKNNLLRMIYSQGVWSNLDC